MSPDGVAAILLAAAAVITAVAGLWREVRLLKGTINGRMTELLDLTRTASRAQGRLAEREGAPPEDSVRQLEP